MTDVDEAFVGVLLCLDDGIDRLVGLLNLVFKNSSKLDFLAVWPFNQPKLPQSFKILLVGIQLGFQKDVAPVRHLVDVDAQLRFFFILVLDFFTELAVLIIPSFELGGQFFVELCGSLPQLSQLKLISLCFFIFDGADEFLRLLLFQETDDFTLEL